jgi:formylglycine-generating enzyme required for sulfatase activity
MTEDRKEIILKNTPMVPLSTGLASRGLQVARQLAQSSKQDFTNSIGMKLVLIPKGRFMMGSPESEESRKEEETQREVTISEDYYLSANAVTQAQYQRVMGENPSCFQGDEIEGRDSCAFPVEWVSAGDAMKFCKKLSALPEEKAAGRVYRLPTEAEWEYACRAGSNTAYCFGNDEELLRDYAWFADNSGGQTHPVGEKEPNAWGLYDMHGNVWEWCSDWDGEYTNHSVTDPLGPKVGLSRILRGGSWDDSAASCRSALRNSAAPTKYYSDVTGFRVVLKFHGINQSLKTDK